MTFDFVSARLKHLSWRLHFRALLDGLGSLDESEFRSEHDCELGKWLDSKGIPHYGQLPVVKRLVDVHRELHSVSGTIIQMLREGRVKDARRAFQRLDPLTDEIIDLLQKAEQEILRHWSA